MNIREALLSFEFGFCFGPLFILWIWGVIGSVLYLQNDELNILVFLVAGGVGLIGAVSTYIHAIRKSTLVLSGRLIVFFNLVGVSSIVLWLLRGASYLDIGTILLFYAPIIAIIHLSYEARNGLIGS